MQGENIMYKICRTEQSIQRQRSLEQGLLKMMLTGSYADISVSDFCDRMQIPRKAFYRYFSGKEGVLYALIDHTMMDFYAVDEHRPDTGTPRGDLQRFFTFWYDQRQLLDALSRNGLTAVLTQRAMVLVHQESLISKSVLSTETVRRELETTFALCGLMSMILRWHEMGFPITAREMAEMAMGILSRPLFRIL